MIVDVFGEPGTITVTWSVWGPPTAEPGYGEGTVGMLSIALISNSNPGLNWTFFNSGADIYYDANGLPVIQADNETYTFGPGLDTISWNNNMMTQCAYNGCAGNVGGGVTAITLDPVPLPSTLFLLAPILLIALGKALTSSRSRLGYSC